MTNPRTPKPWTCLDCKRTFPLSAPKVVTRGGFLCPDDALRREKGRELERVTKPRPVPLQTERLW